MDGKVLGFVSQSGVGFHDDTDIDQRAHRDQFGPRPAHIQEDFDIVPTGLMPIDPGDFGYPYPSETMGPPLANSRNRSAADPRVDDARSFDFDTRLDDIAHRPDTDRFTRLRELELSCGDAWVVQDQVEDAVAIDLQAPILPPSV